MPGPRHALILALVVVALSNAAEGRCARKRHRGLRSGAQQDCGRYATESLDDENRINSGYRSRPGQFPSYVGVLPTTQKASFKCGGTLIGERHILTAAHCLPYTTYNVTVKFGGQRVDEGEDDEYQASDWCRASDYRSNHSADMQYPLIISDVAVIELERPVKFNELIQPACLPTPETPPLRYGDQQAYAIGLGKTGNTPETASTAELQVLPVVRQECPPEWGQQETLMCVKANRAEHKGIICNGDSGGPLLALDSQGRQTVFGITSFSYSECLPMDNELHKFTSSGWLGDVVNMMPEINSLLEQCTSPPDTN